MKRVEMPRGLCESYLYLPAVEMPSAFNQRAQTVVAIVLKLEAVCCRRLVSTVSGIEGEKGQIFWVAILNHHFATVRSPGNIESVWYAILECHRCTNCQLPCESSQLLQSFVVCENSSFKNVLLDPVSLSMRFYALIVCPSP